MENLLSPIEIKAHVSDTLSYQWTCDSFGELVTIEVTVDLHTHGEKFIFKGPLKDASFQSGFWSLILQDFEKILPLKSMKDFTGQSIKASGDLRIQDVLYKTEVRLGDSNLSVFLTDVNDATCEYSIWSEVQSLSLKQAPFLNIRSALYAGLLSDVYCHMLKQLKKEIIDSKKLIEDFVKSLVEQAVTESKKELMKLKHGTIVDAEMLMAVASTPTYVISFIHRLPTSSCLSRARWYMSGCDFKDRENTLRIALATIHLSRANTQKREPGPSDHTVFLNSISLETNSRANVLKIEDEMTGIFSVLENELDTLLTKDSLSAPSPHKDLRDISQAKPPLILNSITSFADFLLKLPSRDRGDNVSETLLSLALLRSLVAFPELVWEPMATELFLAKQKSGQFLEAFLRTISKVDKITRSYSALISYLQYCDGEDLAIETLDQLKQMGEMAYHCAEQFSLLRKYEPNFKNLPKIKTYSGLDPELKRMLSLQYSESFGQYLQSLIKRTLHEDMFQQFWVAPMSNTTTNPINYIRNLCCHVYYDNTGYLSAIQTMQYLLDTLRTNNYSRGRSPRNLHVFAQFENVDQVLIYQITCIEICYCVKRLLYEIMDEVQDYSFACIEDAVQSFDSDVELLLQYLKASNDTMPDLYDEKYDSNIFSFEKPVMNYKTALAIVTETRLFAEACQSFISFVSNFKSSVIYVDFAEESSKISSVLEGLKKITNNGIGNDISAYQKFLKWSEVALNAPISDIVETMQKNICEVQLNKQSIIFDRELTDFYVSKLRNKVSKLEFTGHASFSNLMEVENKFLVDILNRLGTNELTDLSAATLEKMNRIVFLLRIRKALRGKKYFAPRDENGVSIKRKVQMGPLSVENILCDFCIIDISSSLQTPATPQSPSRVTSHQVLQITEQDTVEELLSIWRQFIRAPFEGIGSKEVCSCYHQLLDLAGLSSTKMDTVFSIMETPLPYSFDFIAFPPHLISCRDQQFIIMKIVRAGRLRYHAFDNIEGEIDFSVITDSPTVRRISEIFVEFSSQKDFDIRNSKLSELWFQSDDVFPFTIETIKILIRMDSMDLVNFLSNLTDTEGFLSSICKLSESGFELNSGFNWFKDFCSQSGAQATTASSAWYIWVMMGDFVRITLMRNVSDDSRSLSPFLSASAAPTQSLTPSPQPYRKRISSTSSDIHAKSSNILSYCDKLKGSMSKYRLVRLLSGQEIIESITKIVTGATPQTRIGTCVSFLAWHLLRENITKIDESEKFDILLHANFPNALQNDISEIKKNMRDTHIFETLTEMYANASATIFSLKHGRVALYQSLASAYVSFSTLLRNANKYSEEQILKTEATERCAMVTSLMTSVRKWCTLMIKVVKKLLNCEWTDLDFGEIIVGETSEENEILKKSGLLLLATDLKEYLKLVDKFNRQLSVSDKVFPRNFASQKPVLIIADAIAKESSKDKIQPIYFDYIDFTELRKTIAEYETFASQENESYDLVELVSTARCVSDLALAIDNGIWLQGEEVSILHNTEIVKSVASLLLQVPYNLPTTKIRTTIQEIDIECSNKTVERTLIDSIVSGRVCLESLEGQKINVSNLEASIQMGSQHYEKLNERSRKLLITARVLLRLRQGILSRDWELVRRGLETNPKVVKEAEREIRDISRICDYSQEIRETIIATLSENKVCGRPDKLNLSHVITSSLLMALSKFENSDLFGSISSFDRKLKYSVNIVKSLRNSLLLSNFSDMSACLRTLQITEVVEAATEEVELVEASREFFEIISRAEVSLLDKVPYAAAIGETILIGSINTVALDDCLDAFAQFSSLEISSNLKVFYDSIKWLKELRNSIKAENWGEQVLEQNIRNLITGNIYQHQYSAVEIVKFNIGKEIFSFEVSVDSLLTQDAIHRESYTPTKNFNTPKYLDKQNVVLFLTSCLKDCVTLHGPSVAEVLGRIPTLIFAGIENEVLFARDELYTRTLAKTLQSCLVNDDRTEQTVPVPLLVEMSLLLGIKTNNIDIQHKTALLLNDLREAIKNRNFSKIVDVLTHAHNLKRIGKLDKNVTAQIEAAFRLVFVHSFQSNVLLALNFPGDDGNYSEYRVNVDALKYSLKLLDDSNVSTANSPTIEPYFAIATACLDLTRALRSGVILNMQDARRKCASILMSNKLDCDKKKFFNYVLKSELSKFSNDFQNISDTFVSSLSNQFSSEVITTTIEENSLKAIMQRSSFTSSSAENLKFFVNLLQMILNSCESDTISLKRNGRFHTSLSKLVESKKEISPISRFVLIVLYTFFESFKEPALPLDVGIENRRARSDERGTLKDSKGEFSASVLVYISFNIMRMSLDILKRNILSSRKPLLILGELSTLASEQLVIRQSKHLAKHLNLLVADVHGTTDFKILDSCSRKLTS